MNNILWVMKLLFLALLCGGCSAADKRQVISDCERYKRSLENPFVMSHLEGWFIGLPDYYDHKQLSRGAGKFPGVGQYSLPLKFDPSLVGLRPDAEARLSLNEDGRISALYITDVRGVMFAFRIDNNRKYFEATTLEHSRGDRVGVTCLRKNY